MKDVEYNYQTLNELGNKIISFPELKSHIEENFVCKKCLFEMNLSAISKGKLLVWQQTYGIATVIKISCGNAHCVEIVPERIDTLEEKHMVKNFVLNYKLLILMQMLGKGLKSIAIITALLGLHTSLGFYTTWKVMLDKLGTIQTNLAQKCCEENLQKEINATIAKGNYEMCGDHIGIAASGDAGWQGAGSCNTYNSISGHTLLVGGYTKLVLAFKFFSKICQTCSNLQKKYGKDFDMNLVPPH